LKNMNYQIDTLRPVAVFATVAETGSFRRAAEELKLSAPLVSQIVSGLEEDLGAQLLYRSTRRITLTDAGKRLLDKARPAFDLIGEAIAEARGSTSEPKGYLKVTAPTVLASPAFAKFLAQYQHQFPQVELEIDLADEHRDPIAERIDLAIRIGQPAGGDRIVRKLFETSGIICGSPAMAASISRPEDLERSLLLLPPTLSGLIQLQRDRESVEISPKSRMVINNGALIRQMVISGEGFALFPEFTVNDAIHSGALVNLMSGWTVGVIPVNAVFTARRARLSSARHFVDELARYISQL
jgi:DNA-binding transcriptional LysR family regulator